MKPIELGMAVLPEIGNSLRNINSVHEVLKVDHNFETLRNAVCQVNEAEENLRTIGHALLFKLADELSQLPSLTGNLILRLTATEETPIF